jgi:hypothetical protein
MHFSPFHCSVYKRSLYTLLTIKNLPLLDWKKLNNSVILGNIKSSVFWDITYLLTLLTYLICSSYTLRCRGCFFILIISKTVGLLGRVISSSQSLYLNTGQHKHRINTYSCLVWDWNPRSRLPSERRPFMFQTAGLPWPALGYNSMYFLESQSMSGSNMSPSSSDSSNKPNNGPRNCSKQSNLKP